MHIFPTEQKFAADYIVQLLYRRLKGLPLTIAENKDLDAWLDRSSSNRKILENLCDEEWLAEARKRYHAPGKEEGLQKLRQLLFNKPKPKPWWRQLADFLVPVVETE